MGQLVYYFFALEFNWESKTVKSHLLDEEINQFREGRFRDLTSEQMSNDSLNFDRVDNVLQPAVNCTGNGKDIF